MKIARKFALRACRAEARSASADSLRLNAARRLAQRKRR
jgi:hypothetical protein